MKAFPYQRMVLGYHGCDATVRDAVITGKSRHLNQSQKDHDWLGPGIYFWEHGPERAVEWAEWKKSRKEIATPAAIGAIIHLGNCFDLLDRRHTRMLSASFPNFETDMRRDGTALPENKAVNKTDNDRLFRNLDCAVIKWTLSEMEKAFPEDRYQSVRGLFQEGVPAFKNSGIHEKSHIQIAVRDAACIIGYFLPTFER